MFCGSQTLIKHSAGRVQIKPAPCNSWGCDTCAPRRRDTVEMAIEDGKPDALVTLTTRRAPGACPIAARRDLGKWTLEFFRRVERLTGQHVERFNVCEKHRSGWPHLHVACRGWKFVDVRTLWSIWRSITGGSDGVNVKRIPPKRIKRYLAKYLGKDLHKFGDSKRYWRTKGWHSAGWKKPSPDDCDRWEGWVFERKHPREVQAEWQKKGWWPHRGEHGEVVMTPPIWHGRSPRGPP
jgi:hypothetical protein